MVLSLEIITPIDDLAVNDGHQNLGLFDFQRIDGKDVLRQDDHVGELPGGDRSQNIFLERRIGGGEGKGLDGLFYRDLFFRYPAVRPASYR